MDSPQKITGEPTNTSALPLAQGVRPKAYRRPPHWVSPHSPMISEISTLSARTALAPIDEPTKIIATIPPVRASDPRFGLALVIIVLLANGALAFALRALDSKPAQENAIFRLRQEPARISPAPDITLFATPLSTRHLAGPTGDTTDSVTTFSASTARATSGTDE